MMFHKLCRVRCVRNSFHVVLKNESTVIDKDICVVGESQINIDRAFFNRNKKARESFHGGSIGDVGNSLDNVRSGNGNNFIT